METMGKVVFWGPGAVSLAERSTLQCPFLGESFIRGFTVYKQNTGYRYSTLP